MFSDLNMPLFLHRLEMVLQMIYVPVVQYIARSYLTLESILKQWC